MPPWRTDRRIAAALLAGAAAAALLAGPLRGQDAPKSLLPPGFGAPPPAAPAAPAAPLPADAAPPPPAAAAPPPAPNLLPPDIDTVAAAETADTDADQTPEPPPELPEGSRRPIERVGLFDRAGGGFGDDAWGAANGQTLATLMSRLDAPIASRWAEILLRRALLTRVPTPAGIAAPDWVAARGWLLLRLGEADGARMLTAAVDVDQFSPRLFEVSAQASLAAADPAGLCPLVAALPNATTQFWTLARGMCAGLSGDATTASGIVDPLRDRLGQRDIDVLLAEKVVGAGSAGRRAVSVDWTTVTGLSSWRFGLASATGLTIPDRLYDTAGEQVRAWGARAPMIPPAARIPLARLAAADGVFSSGALVDLYAAAGDADGTVDDAGSPAGRLRAAFAADTVDARMDAIRSFWDEAQPGLDRYAAAILTARPAALLRPDAALGGKLEPLIAAMLSAGYDFAAERWAAVTRAQSGRDGQGAWALLAVGAPHPVMDTSAPRVQAFADAVGDGGRHRAQLLVAALAGLGRLPLEDASRLSAGLGAGLGKRDSWTGAIDRAGVVGEDGTVALLAGVGLQARSWDAVPAFHLFHIVAALRRAGHEPEARMIAAEAITRT